MDLLMWLMPIVTVLIAGLAVMVMYDRPRSKLQRQTRTVVLSLFGVCTAFVAAQFNFWDSLTDMVLVVTLIGWGMIIGMYFERNARGMGDG